MDLQEFQVLHRWGCPVCTERFPTLAEKKQHVKEEHPR